MPARQKNMKNKIITGCANIFGFLSVGFLMVIMFGAVKAQTRSASVDLQGTEWEGAPISYAAGSAVGTLQCFYIFENQGKVIYKCLAFQSPGTMAGTNLNDPAFIPGVDDPYKPKLVVTPGASGTSEVAGKYVQNGNSIRLEFADAVMNATVNGNILTGKTVFKNAGKGKEKWVMQRISKNKSDSTTADNKTTNQLGGSHPVSQQLAIQQQIDERKSENKKGSSSVSAELALMQQREKEESENKSQFSLSEFQNSYFKPNPLTRNIISGTNPEGNLNHLNYSFVADSGTLNITFSLNASRESYASQVVVEVQDRENNVLAKKFVTTNVGKSAQDSISIDISQKQALLLRITLSGGGTYQVELNGLLVLEK